MRNRKYKLVNKAKMSPGSTYRGTEVFYQLKALIDIPLYGVKAGDLGGFVSSKKILSHDGSCWIGGTAKAYKGVEIIDDAYVGEKAIIVNDFRNSTITISEKARIMGNAIVEIRKFYDDGDDIAFHTAIMGNAIIGGNGRIQNASKVKDNVKILGDTTIRSANISGNTIIKGNAEVKSGAKVSGNSYLCDDSVIEENASIHDCIVSGKARIASKSTFSDKKFTKEGIFKGKDLPVFIIGDVSNGENIQAESAKLSLELSTAGETIADSMPISEVELIQEHFQELKRMVDAYQTDIVKIIKYPLMTDRTDSYTVAMTVAMGKANRCAKRTQDVLDIERFQEAVEGLEVKFFMAESHAIKMASTLLSETEQKKTTKASDLFRLASNEASSEQEKKVAFIQGFKQLEGVLTVPEEAIVKFQAKIGLREIEA